MSRQIEACLSASSDGHALVWNVEDVWRLRTEHRIVGRLIGSYAEHSAQNKFNSLPLLLMPEEIVLALSKHWLQLLPASAPLGESSALPATGEETLGSLLLAGAPLPGDVEQRATIFADLWHKGYYLTAGSKFGCHFMAYPGDPLLYHASFIVWVAGPSDKLSILDLVSLARMAVGVKKKAVLATTTIDPHTNAVQAKYLSLDWLGVT